MKTIVAVILALGSVSALGSGPYLPSGWRPQGPAFFLPGEVEKPERASIKEAVVVEVEPSGSEGLLEYGPPKVVEVAQGLPDVVTDQSFYVAERNQEEEITVQSGNVEESEVTEEVTSQAEVQATEALEPEAVTEVTTAAAEVETTAVSVEEKLGQVVVEEEKTLVQVKNISETLFNLEKEIKSEQVQTVEAVTEVKVDEDSRVVSVPEGFLEYGPPGFKEYGPPKAVPLGVAPLVQLSFENNEARRRRFSPKFRSQKGKRHH